MVTKTVSIDYLVRFHKISTQQPRNIVPQDSQMVVEQHRLAYFEIGRALIPKNVLLHITVVWL